MALSGLNRSAPAIGAPKTVQMVNHKKRALNVLSLGIRRKYVRYKRQQQALANQGAVPLPVVVDPLRTHTPLTPIKDEYEMGGNYSESELYEHLKAYEQARYYHATKDINVDSIVANGLDRTHGGSGTGASATADPDSRASNAGKVFVGGDRTTALYYERQLRGDRGATPETLRVFVSPTIEESLVGDFADADNEAFWTAKHDIPANAILRGKIVDKTDTELAPAFGVVREWYPDPDSVSVQEVIERHREAISRGMTVHHTRPGGSGRGRFIRDVTKPGQGRSPEDEGDGYESD